MIYLSPLSICAGSRRLLHAQSTEISVLISLSWCQCSTSHRSGPSLRLSCLVCSMHSSLASLSVQRSIAWSSAQAGNVLTWFFLNMGFTDCKRLLLSFCYKIWDMSGGILLLPKRLATAGRFAAEETLMDLLLCKDQLWHRVWSHEGRQDANVSLILQIRPLHGRAEMGPVLSIDKVSIFKLLEMYFNT